MSIPQGASPSNNQYFSALVSRAEAAGTCASLAAIQTQATTSVNATMAAANSQLATIQASVGDLAKAITDLTAFQATLAAAQASITNVGVVGATASSVSDLGSVIAYSKAQGAALVSFGTTNTSTFAAQIVSVATTLQNIQKDYDTLIAKVETLTAQITNLPAQLSLLQDAIATRASQIPGCSI